jgi:hypothetical protein
MPTSIKPPGYLFALPQLRKYPSSLECMAVLSRAAATLTLEQEQVIECYMAGEVALGRWLGSIQRSS